MSVKTIYQQHSSSKNLERFNEDLLCPNKITGKIFFDGSDKSLGTAKRLRYKCLCT